MIKSQEQTTHAGKKTREDFFIKYFTSHFICKVSKRVTQSLCVRGSWELNITEIFWPRSYGRQRCVFLVLHGCSTGPLCKLFCVLAFPTTLCLLPSSTVLLALLLAYLPLSSIRRPYITFKLPRSNIDTLQRLRNLRETGVKSWVDSYQRFKKWYFMFLCLTLSITRKISRVKWSNQGNGVTYIYIYIYIYIYVDDLSRGCLLFVLYGWF